MSLRVKTRGCYTQRQRRRCRNRLASSTRQLVQWTVEATSSFTSQERARGRHSNLRRDDG